MGVGYLQRAGRGCHLFAQAAESLERGRDSDSAAAKERGVQLGTRERLTPELADLARKMIANRELLASTAQAIGMSKPGLLKWMRRHGVQRPLMTPESDDARMSAPSASAPPT